jgi:tetratricopeptide (TPR) repeat protein
VDPAASLQQQAIELAKRGDFGPDAKRVNQQLAEASPANLGAWTRLARCCIELGQLDEATVAIDSALQLEPQNTIARNMQNDIQRRRMAVAAPVRAPRTRAPASASSSTSSPRAGRSRGAVASAGFGRQEFTSLAHLPPHQALEALGPRLEALLMDINERPFAGKVAEARNRAGRSGIRLFRRNSFRATGPGQLEAFHHGGRWEPQINLGWSAAPARSMRAGIGFNFTLDTSDPEGDVGLERLLAQYARFQRLVAADYRDLLTRWMEANRGFIQLGSDPPATDLLPRQAVQWIVDTDTAPDRGWVFCGRWLFADRVDDEEILADGGRLIRWIDQTFTDLLPLWTAVYRS